MSERVAHMDDSIRRAHERIEDFRKLAIKLSLITITGGLGAIATLTTILVRLISESS